MDDIQDLMIEMKQLGMSIDEMANQNKELCEQLNEFFPMATKKLIELLLRIKECKERVGIKYD